MAIRPFPDERVIRVKETVPLLATPGQIALRLGVPKHRIDYILRSRRYIKPRAIAGMARCFDDDAVAQIRHELNAIDARNARGVSHEDH